MKNRAANFAFIVVSFIFTLPFSVCAQVKPTKKPILLSGKPYKLNYTLTCYASGVENHLRIAPPKAFLQLGKEGLLNTASFDILYSDNFPEEAKVAFDYAASIWSFLLQSDLPIIIEADWTSLQTGVLGSTGLGNAYINIDNAQYANTLYPSALAKKIAPSTIEFDQNIPDITMRFNTSINWYFGTDANPSSGQYDFVTVALHEIGHGLGIIDTYDVTGTQGKWSFDFLPNIPLIYDVEVINNSNQNLVTDDFPNNSALLKSQLESNALFFRSEQAKLSNNGANPKLYAPTSFQPGSSISHLDEAVFSNTVNSLMTPEIGTNEANHNPGPIILGMLSDMGWSSVFFTHEKVPNTENTVEDFEVIATITSDSTLLENTATIHYSLDGFNTQNISIPMSPSGTPNEFKGLIPAFNVDTTFVYYIEIEDQLRGYTIPALYQGTSKKETIEQAFVVRAKQDLTAPVIKHQDIKYQFVHDTALVFTAEITDQLALKESYIDWTVNNIPQPNLNLGQIPNTSIYTDTLTYEKGTYSPGDVVAYRVVAIDNAASLNQSNFPENGYFHFNFETLNPFVSEYKNDFNTSTSDFASLDVKIHTPTGFNDGALHFEHPYAEGYGPGDESEFVAVLKTPIQISAGISQMAFKEVVLIEPGDAQATSFGHPLFWDYVIVEASLDSGKVWFPVADGYDSRLAADFENTYNSAIDADGFSSATGNASLFKGHLFNLKSNENLKTGDIALFRFRIFSDQNAHGWGWTIDDLEIQGTITSLKNTKPGFSIYPNPTKDKIVYLESNALPSAGAIQPMLYDGKGRRMQTVQIKKEQQRLVLDLTHLPAGLYYLHLDLGSSSLKSKIILQD